MMWHSSERTSPKDNTFPSQGELIVLGSSSGGPLLIFLVKNALKVGY
jgi:hypothetical protein